MQASTSSLDHSNSSEGAKPEASALPSPKARWHAPVLKRLEIERTASGHSGKIESAHSTS